jgi:predicted nucleic acid-binding protein
VVILLDAYAALALLRDEPAAELVQGMVERDEEATLTLMGVAEVLDRLVRLSGISERDATLNLERLGLSEPPALDATLATSAGLLRARYYQRRTRSLSLADCVAAETARRHGASLATADGPLLDTCTDEGIAVIALPDSNGRVWTRL